MAPNLTNMVRQGGRLNVRDAVLSDLEALTAIKPSSAVHQDRIRDAQVPSFCYLVLEWDGALIGFACLVFKRPAGWSDAAKTDHLPQVVDLQVAPRLRGNGYGSFFIRAMEQMAIERGFDALYLAVDPVDNPRAHSLYVRLGFTPVQSQPYRSHWEFVDSAGALHQGDEWSLDMVKRLT